MTTTTLDQEIETAISEASLLHRKANASAQQAHEDLVAYRLAHLRLRELHEQRLDTDSQLR